MSFAVQDTPSIKRLFIESLWHKWRDIFALSVPFFLPCFCKKPRFYDISRLGTIKA
jgi:hypothetical protein